MKDTIIFDLDGTILNTLKGIANSCNHALVHFGYTKKSLQEIKRELGTGGHNLIKGLVPSDVDKEKIEEIFDYYTKYYSNNYFYKTKPYENVIKVLKKLKKQGYKLAIISNKQDEIVQKLSNKFFKKYMIFTTGALDNKPLKPDTYLVDLFLNKRNIKKENVLYIGDSEVDVLTARNSGIEFIGVTWGFRDISLLIDNGCEYFIDDFKQLLEVLLND